MLAVSIFGQGSTSFARAIVAARVKPHAPLAWNIGVFGKSCPVKYKAQGMSKSS
jgi:hypothetical protein